MPQILSFPPRIKWIWKNKQTNKQTASQRCHISKWNTFGLMLFASIWRTFSEFYFKILTFISFIVSVFIYCRNSCDSKPIQIVFKCDSCIATFFHCNLYRRPTPPSPISIYLHSHTHNERAMNLHFECQTSTGGSFVCSLSRCQTFHCELCELITCLQMANL